MRTISTPQGFVITSSSKARAEHLRVSVKDSGGTFRDLTTYPGLNLVDSATWGESVEDAHMSAEVTFRREHYNISLAPLVATSPLNLGFVSTATASPLLAVARELKIEVAVLGADIAPVSGDWMLVFHGVIDSVDAGSGDQVKVTARDLGARLMDAYLEEEYVLSYGSVGGLPVAMRLWAPSTAYALNDYVLPSDSNRNPYFYKVTVAGTSGTTEPTWPTSAGTVVNGTATFSYQAATSTSGFPVEQVMQSLLDRAGFSSVVLYTPTSPSWNITQYKQDRTALLEALRALAFQLGWDVRYKYRSGTSQYELTLYEPERTKVATDRTFSSAEYTEISSLRVDISGIRNVVRVVYSDAADLMPDGTAKRKFVESSDATSITTYGRRFMELAESSSSQIDSSSEATRLADAALADLKDPTVEQSVELAAAFVWAELGDLYRWSANTMHYTAAQDLSVHSYRHSAQAGAIVTSLDLRGKPALGVDRWLEWESHPGNPRQGVEPHSLSMFEVMTNPDVEVTSIPGGIEFKLVKDPALVSRDVEYEYHLDPNSAFAPSDTTLVAVSKSNTLSVSDLNPGVTYYVKTVPRIRNEGKIVRGQPSAAVAATAGYANGAHINPDLSLAYVPTNWQFATQTAAVASNPPDGWRVETGSWGSGSDVYENTSTVRTGSRSVEFRNTATFATILSDYIPVIEGQRYFVETWRYASATTGSLALQVVFYSVKGLLLTTQGFSSLAIATSGAWDRVSYADTVPAGAKWAKIRVGKGAAGVSTWSLYVDLVRFWEDAQQRDVQGFGFANTFAEQDSTNAPFAARIDRNGVLHFLGRVKPGVSSGLGTSGTARMTTLPAGYIPDKEKYLVVPFYNGATSLHETAVIYINPSGQIHAVTGSTNTSSWWCFDGVCFPLDYNT